VKAYQCPGAKPEVSSSRDKDVETCSYICANQWEMGFCGSLQETVFVLESHCSETCQTFFYALWDYGSHPWFSRGKLKGGAADREIVLERGARRRRGRERRPAAWRER